MLTTNCGYDDPVQGPGLLVLYGPATWVNVGLDPNYKPNSNAAPVPGIANIEALIDSGADESCIDSGLAAHLKLPIVDQQMVVGVSGNAKVNFHLAQVHVPALKFTSHGSFAGVPLVASGFRCRVLLGRTFLRHFKMVYDGRSGAVTLSC